MALEVAEYFRLDKIKAKRIINEVTKSVRNWKKIASDIGISRSEQDLKALAFETKNL